MKKKVTVCCQLILFAIGITSAQTNPGTWVFSAKKMSAMKYEVVCSAMIASPWHIYSQFTPAGGPLPTKITILKNPLLFVNSKATEAGTLYTRFEKVFRVDVKFFKGRVDFIQHIKIQKPMKTVLNGTVEYMLCNDEQCLPPTTLPFSIALQ